MRTRLHGSLWTISARISTKTAISPASICLPDSKRLVPAMLKRHELQSDLRRNLVSVAHIRPLSSISFRVLASTSSVGLGRNAITQLTTVTIDEETAYYTSPVLRVGLFSEAYRFYLILWLDRISGVGTPQLRVPPGLVDRSWTFPNIHFLFLCHDNEGCFRRVHISTAAYQGGVNRDAKGYLSFPCVSGWVDNWDLWVLLDLFPASRLSMSWSLYSGFWTTVCCLGMACAIGISLPEGPDGSSLSRFHGWPARVARLNKNECDLPRLMPFGLCLGEDDEIVAKVRTT